MRSVDFIYFTGCPNAEPARANLAAAFTEIEAEPRWVEWDVGDAATPAEFGRYGSPTVLVNGRDVVAAGTLSGGNGCRIYETANGLTGVPSVALLVQALREPTADASATQSSPHGWGSHYVPVSRYDCGFRVYAGNHYNSGGHVNRDSYGQGRRRGHHGH